MKSQTIDNRLTAIAFYRVSTDKQTNDRQFSDVQQYCKAYGYILLKEFQETISGASKLSQRKELCQMLEFVEANRPKYVICSELSRLARSQDAITIIKDWTDKGVCFVSLKENIITLDANGKSNPMTDLLLSIMTALNIFELETIKYRVRSGLSKAIYEDKNWSGAIPYGYRSVDKKLVVYKDEAENVRMMFQKYADGWGTLKIATHLNRQDILTTLGRYWRDQKIYKILSNPVYVGRRRWNNEFLEQSELRIIDEQTFTVVAERLKGNGNTSDLNKKNKHNYLLAGKIICKCGQHFVGQKNEKYICKSNKYAGGCKIKQVNKEWIESQVKQELFINYGSLLDDNKKVIDNIASLETELFEIAVKINKERSHQNYLINSISRIGEQKFNEKFDASLSYLNTLSSKNDEINKKLKASQQFSKLIAPWGMQVVSSNTVIPVIGTGELKIDKELIQAAVERIDINNESIKVNLVNGNSFNLPRVIVKRGRQPKK
jgi:site-specific DNA recombinase